MPLSVFILAAAADSILHTITPLVRHLTATLRPSGLVLAFAFQVRFVSRWICRGADTAIEQLGRTRTHTRTRMRIPVIEGRAVPSTRERLESGTAE